MAIDGVADSLVTNAARYACPVMTVQELLGAVLELPVEDRARFARELLLSLKDDVAEPGDEQGLIDELDRRRRQVEAGEVRMQDRAEFEQPSCGVEPLDDQTVR